MSTDEKPKGTTLKSLNGSFDRAATMNPDNARADSVQGASKMRSGHPTFDSINGAVRMRLGAQQTQQTAKGVAQKATAPAPSKPVSKK